METIPFRSDFRKKYIINQLPVYDASGIRVGRTIYSLQQGPYTVSDFSTEALNSVGNIAEQARKAVGNKMSDNMIRASFVLRRTPAAQLLNPGTAPLASPPDVAARQNAVANYQKKLTSYENNLAAEAAAKVMVQRNLEAKSRTALIPPQTIYAAPIQTNTLMEKLAYIKYKLQGPITPQLLQTLLSDINRMLLSDRRYGRLEDALNYGLEDPSRFRMTRDSILSNSESYTLQYLSGKLDLSKVFATDIALSTGVKTYIVGQKGIVGEKGSAGGTNAPARIETLIVSPPELQAPSSPPPRIVV